MTPEEAKKLKSGDKIKIADPANALNLNGQEFIVGTVGAKVIYTKKENLEARFPQFPLFRGMTNSIIPIEFKIAELVAQSANTLKTPKPPSIKKRDDTVSLDDILGKKNTNGCQCGQWVLDNKPMNGPHHSSWCKNFTNKPEIKAKEARK